ncbi:MAG: hypothetical protein JF588_06095 [Caulobacterales bacterium]|nr:hypothetical protein [Caulobacterales bacterium]
MKPVVRGTSLVAVALVVALVFAHLFAFGILSAHLAAPAAVVGGAALLLLAAHLGVLGPASAWLRRRFHPEPDDRTDS